MRPAFLIYSFFFLCCCCGTLRADTPVDPSLSKAIAAAAPLEHSFVISVGADRILLAPNMTALPPGADMDQVAAAYGRICRDFGVVHAVAPPTMVVLNTAPDNPDIAQGLSPTDKFTLLADSLSDSQWQELVGPNGLAIGDLNEKQQSHVAGESATAGGTPDAGVNPEFNKLNYVPMTIEMIDGMCNPQSLDYGGKPVGVQALVVDLTTIALSGEDPVKALADAMGATASLK